MRIVLTVAVTVLGLLASVQAAEPELVQIDLFTASGRPRAPAFSDDDSLQQ